MTTRPFNKSPIDYGDKKLQSYRAEDSNYTVEPITEEIHFNERGINANQTKTWLVPCHIKPEIMWIQEASLQSNKTITWRIYNELNTLLWEVPVTFGSMTAMGNTSYYLFPNLTIEGGWKATITPSVALTGFLVIARRNVEIIAELAPLD